MNVILYLGIFWMMFGIIGFIFKIQPLPEKYKPYRDLPCTKEYMRKIGLSWVMLGAPYIIIYVVNEISKIDAWINAISIILVAIPAIFYTVKAEKSYKKELENLMK